MGSAYSYYENSVARGVEDYYSGLGEMSGYWIGNRQALKEVGLISGSQPKASELSALLENGVDPHEGQ